MSELPRLFENAKVGDDVLCARRGWVKISRIDHDSGYPIRTKFDSYTLDGKCLEGDSEPTLWPADNVPQYFLDLFPRPKKKVKKVIERWANVYPDTMSFYRSEEIADCYSNPERIACVKLTGEYWGKE